MIRERNAFKINHRENIAKDAGSKIPGTESHFRFGFSGSSEAVSIKIAASRPTSECSDEQPMDSQKLPVARFLGAIS